MAHTRAKTAPTILPGLRPLGLALIAALALAGCDASNGGQEPAPAPAAPASVETEPLPGAIEVTWTDNSDGEDGFRVYRATTDGAPPEEPDWSRVATTPPDVTRYMDEDVSDEHAYRYAVTAFRDDRETELVEQRSDEPVQPEPTEHVLTIEVEGDGLVRSDPGGIQCGDDCTDTFPSGEAVTLTAEPGPDSSFQSWSGACEGSEPTCNVTLTTDTTVTATFALEEQCDDTRIHEGDLVIDAEDPSAHDDVREVTGGLFVEDTGLVALEGFPCLETVGEILRISDNQQLARIGGFDELTAIGQGLVIASNPSLATIEPFEKLHTITGPFQIHDNDALVELAPFPELREVGGDVALPGFEVTDNASLPTLVGFDALQRARASFEIRGNTALESIDGFGSLRRADWSFHVGSNPRLTSMRGFESLEAAGGGQAQFLIEGESLAEIPEFASLETAGFGGFRIANTALAEIEGFPSLTRIGNEFGLFVADNRNLAEISGFGALTDVWGGVRISGNGGLGSITGFRALETVHFGDLRIVENGATVTIDAFHATRSIETDLVLEDVEILCPSFQELTEVTGAIRVNGDEESLPLECRAE